MNKQEIAKAQQLLANRVDRFETIIDGDGQSLTAHWVDGGQKMFATLYDVEQWLSEKHRVASL